MAGCEVRCRGTDNAGTIFLFFLGGGVSFSKYFNLFVFGNIRQR